MKNRIINGAMVIDQRNAGAALTVAPSSTAYYGIDRYQVWSFPSGAAGTWTWQQQTATPPVGFTYYGRATVTTPDTSVTTNDFYTIQQPIEGYNLADLEFGTANAKPFTVSFWVRSSLTGTFSCAVNFGVSSQGYALTYTINSANTWEYKTVNFPALTSSLLATNNKTSGVSLYLVFALGLGSNFTGAAGTLGSSVYGVTGATNLISTNGATLDITGVQLEVGSTATSFDYRPYGTELNLCLRYYYKWLNDTGTDKYIANMQAYSTTAAYGKIFDYPVPMRASPTCSRSGTFRLDTATSANAGNPSTVDLGVGTRFSMASGDIKSVSGLVAGNCSVFSVANNGYLDASAEL
jgi:hypothetical protein